MILIFLLLCLWARLHISHRRDASWLTTWVWKSHRPEFEFSFSWLGDPGQFAHPSVSQLLKVGGQRRAVSTLYYIHPLMQEKIRNERWGGSVWIPFLCFSPPGPAPLLTAEMCDLKSPAHCLAEPGFPPAPRAQLNAAPMLTPVEGGLASCSGALMKA